MIIDANGDLFGTSSSGGLLNNGTVFEIKNNGTVAAPIYDATPTTLVLFNGADGVAPAGPLIVDANGDLFGTTVGGGTGNDGTAFEITNSGYIFALAGTYACARGECADYRSGGNLQ